MKSLIKDIGRGMVLATAGLLALTGCAGRQNDYNVGRSLIDFDPQIEECSALNNGMVYCKTKNKGIVTLHDADYDGLVDIADFYSQDGNRYLLIVREDFLPNHYSPTVISNPESRNFLEDSLFRSPQIQQEFDKATKN